MANLTAANRTDTQGTSLEIKGFSADGEVLFDFENVA